jgi:geranylgeranyl diphosphate synthase type II
MYKNIVDAKVFEHLRINMPKGVLYDACKHALTGGKRIRSSIVLGMAGYDRLDSIEDQTGSIELAAISVEYLHTASLIIDDLPCMDNDLERRGAPTVHAKYGERVAQLASTSLMAAAIECLAQAVENLDKKVGLYIIRFVGDRMGSSGASGGEMKEFQHDAPVKEIIHMKTSTFFEIAMILGWLFGGPTRELEKCKDVSEAAKCLGLAYQIADDMEDVEQDMKTETKDANYVIRHGLELSKSHFRDALTEMLLILPEEALCDPIIQLAGAFRCMVIF